MAMLVLMPPVVEIEGQGPGGIYRKDQCGQHLQKPPRPINKSPSPEQIARQNYFKLLMQYIRDHATQSFVLAWSQYAAEHPKKTKKGKEQILSWHQAFISYNLQRFPPGIPIIDRPPGYPHP